MRHVYRPPLFLRSCSGFRIRRSSAWAFTLLELIVVMAIIVILTAMAIPAFTSLNKASNLTNSGALLVDQLTAGRQEALSRNRVVEARFYQLPGELAGSPASFRAFRLFIYDEKIQTASALTKLYTFSPGVIAIDDPNFSTIISTKTNQRVLTPSTDTVPGSTTPLTYQAFRFRATGGTDLSPNGATSSGTGGSAASNDKWFITLKAENDPVVGTFPAHNYITAMIDPVSGRIRIFRP